MEMNSVPEDLITMPDDSVPECKKKTMETNSVQVDLNTLSDDNVPECKKLTMETNSVQMDLSSLSNGSVPEWKTKMRICDACGKMFTATRLWSHYRTAHKGILSAYCEVCGKGFISGALLRRHMPVHTGEKLYKCDLCDKSLSQSSALHRHKKNVHKVDSPICQICNRSFQTEESLLSHVRLVHTKQTFYGEKTPTKFSCSVCNRIYLRRRGLRNHIKSAHTERPLIYECDQCDKKFAVRNLLKQHLNVHSKSKKNDKSYTCTVCQMVFVSYEKFYKHRKLCCKLFPCSVCEEECVSTLALSRHITNHHLNDSSVRSKTTCETCGKKFRDSYRLRRHVNIHSSPLHCDKCGKEFKRRHNLLSHQQKSCKRKRKRKSTRSNKIAQKPESDIKDALSDEEDLEVDVNNGVETLDSDVEDHMLPVEDIKLEVIESLDSNIGDHLLHEEDIKVEVNNVVAPSDSHRDHLSPNEDIRMDVNSRVVLIDGDIVVIKTEPLSS